MTSYMAGGQILGYLCHHSMGQSSSVCRFDNFQFVDFHGSQRDSRNPEAALSLAALMEVGRNMESNG